ncbi:hypothetical protein ANN_01142 [Periplaneta americana]|uniref:Uncharacterized protein n=1 Tax=Periplaneta americana TaxID=6978 RepID=A0ABQ8TTV5_PERAM|nr:hypothetical protein ANN_01142 [Periplaneta americana]
MLQEEWRRIPVDIVHKLVESMPDRVAAVIATKDPRMFPIKLLVTEDEAQLEKHWLMMITDLNSNSRMVESYLRLTRGIICHVIRQKWYFCLEQRGESQVDIVDLIGISQSVISRVLSRFRETGLVTRRPGSGSNRKTTPRQDRHIIIQARRTPFAKARHIQQNLQKATGLLVSDQTIRNGLWAGLTFYRPLRNLALESIHRRQRLAWVNQRIEEDILWGNVFFTNESRYCFFNDNRRRRVYRSAGNRSLLQYVQRVVSYGGGSVTVWGGVSLGWRTELHILDGVLRGQRYSEEMVSGCISNKRDAVGQENFIFLDDNARAHRAAVVTEALENLQINHLSLPSRSSDLNAIENV